MIHHFRKTVEEIENQSGSVQMDLRRHLNEFLLQGGAKRKAEAMKQQQENKFKVRRMNKSQQQQQKSKKKSNKELRIQDQLIKKISKLSNVNVDKKIEQKIKTMELLIRKHNEKEKEHLQHEKCINYAFGANKKTDAKDIFSLVIEDEIMCLSSKKIQQYLLKKKEIKINLPNGNTYIFTKDDIQRFREHQKVKPVTIFKEDLLFVIIESFGMYLYRKSPQVFKSMMGFTSKLTPSFVKKLFRYSYRIVKYIFSNRTFISVCLYVYSYIKILICLYMLPQTKGQPNLAQQYMEQTAKPVTDTLKLTQSIYDCGSDLINYGTSYFGVGFALYASKCGLNVTVYGVKVMKQLLSPFVEMIFPGSTTTENVSDREHNHGMIKNQLRHGFPNKIRQEIISQSAEPTALHLFGLLKFKLVRLLLIPFCKMMVPIMINLLKMTGYGAAFAVSLEMSWKAIEKTNDQSKFIDGILRIMLILRDYKQAFNVFNTMFIEIYKLIKCLSGTGPCCYTNDVIEGIKMSNCSSQENEQDCTALGCQWRSGWFSSDCVIPHSYHKKRNDERRRRM